MPLKVWRMLQKPFCGSQMNLATLIEFYLAKMTKVNLLAATKNNLLDLLSLKFVRKWRLRLENISGSKVFIIIMQNNILITVRCTYEQD